MAGPISSLYVEFSASTKKFSDAMGEVTRSVKEVDKVIKPIRDRMADVGKAMTAGLTVPILGLGAAAFSSAMKIDEAMDSIRAQTGATGKTLENLGADFRTVFAEVPNTIDDVSKAIGELSSRTGLAGKPLQDLATQMLNVSRLTKTDINETIASATRVFGDWGIATNKQSAALDFLFKVGQQTGIGFSALSRSVQQFGVPLREMGFSFEQAAVLLGKFEKEGVNADVVMAALRKSLATLGKAGVTDAAAALNVLVDRIQKAGTASQANGVAIAAFGAKAGPTLAAAIREGHFALNDLMASIQGSPDTINKAAEATLSFGEKLDILKHKTMEALEPIGVQLMDALERLIPTAQRALGVIANLANGFSKLGPGTQDAIIGVAALVAVIGPAITILTKISSVIIGTIALVAKLGFSFTALGDVIAGAGLIAGVGSFAELESVIALIAGVSAAATAGLFALAGAVGVVTGLIVNWLIEGTKIREWLDKLVVSVENFVGLTGKWGTDQKAVTTAMNQGADATKKLTDELTRRNIAFDKTRLNDSAYVATLGQQIKAQAQLATATAATGTAAASSAKDLAAINKMLAGGKDAASEAAKALAELKKHFEETLKPADDLNATLMKLKSTGVNNAEILVTYARQIVEAAKAQRDHGFIVTGVTRQLEEQAQALLDVQANTQGYADAAKASAEAQKQLLDSFASSLKPADDLNKTLDQLRELHKTDSDIVSVYAAQIVAAAAAQREHGYAVEGGVAQLEALAIAYEDAAKMAKEADVVFAEEDSIFQKSVRAAAEATTQAEELAEAIKRYGDAGFTAKEIIARLGGDLDTAAKDAKEFGTQLDPATAALIKLQSATKQSEDEAKKWDEVWKNAMGHVVSDFADAVSNMLFEGKKFSDSMKSLFKSLAETLVKTLVTGAFTKIGKSLSTLLAGGSLGGVGKAIGSIFGIGVSAGGAAGGAAAGGAAAGGAGGGLGASAAAFATNPITIAAAGAIAAGIAIKHFVGEGRKAADAFTTGSKGQVGLQGQFDKSLGFLVDTFDQAKAAGTLTLDGAKQTKDALTSLWQNFLDASSQFAAQGKNQAKVVGQAMAGYTKNFGSNLSNLFADINGGIAALQANADGTAKGAPGSSALAGIPTTGRAASASTIFADAVESFKGIIDKIGTMMPGGAAGGVPISLSITSAPVITIEGGAAFGVTEFRDEVVPMLLDDLSKNARGITETMVRILANAQTGVTSTGGLPA